MTVSVQNELGRELELSDEDYNALKEKGFKMKLLDKESFEVLPTDAVAYTAIVDTKGTERTDVKCFGDENIFDRRVMEAKRYKILPHKFFGNMITIWIDGNIYLKENEDYYVAKFLKDADIAIFTHPYRDTVWQEFEVLQKQDRFKIDWLQQQLKEQQRSYEQEGLPKDTPLWECNFIICRNTPKVNRFMDAWWAEICRWQWRDQVSLPYVVWKYGQDIKLRTITDGNIRKHKLFKYVEKY